MFAKTEYSGTKFILQNVFIVSYFVCVRLYDSNGGSTPCPSGNFRVPAVPRQTGCGKGRSRGTRLPFRVSPRKRVPPGPSVCRRTPTRSVPVPTGVPSPEITGGVRRGKTYFR